MSTIMFIIGLMVGGSVATIVMCCLQINRINSIYAEVEEKLKKLNNKNH